MVSLHHLVFIVFNETIFPNRKLPMLAGFIKIHMFVLQRITPFVFFFFCSDVRGPLTSDPGGLTDFSMVSPHIHHPLSLTPRGHPAVPPLSTAPGRVPGKDNTRGLALKG